MNEVEFASWVDAMDEMLHDASPPEIRLLLCPYLTDQEADLAARELQRRGHEVKVLPVKSVQLKLGG